MSHSMPAPKSPIVKRDGSGSSKFGARKSPKTPTKRISQEIKEEAAETESEFTKRVISAKPRGIKGLGFILRELQKAKVKGLFADHFKNVADKENNRTKGLGILGKRLKENVITKLDVEQKSIELMRALKANKNDILDRMMKE